MHIPKTLTQGNHLANTMLKSEERCDWAKWQKAQNDRTSRPVPFPGHPAAGRRTVQEQNKPRSFRYMGQNDSSLGD